MSMGKMRLLALAALLAGSAGLAQATSWGTARIKYAGSSAWAAGFSADYNFDGTVDQYYNNNVLTGEYKFSFDAGSPDSTGAAQQLLGNPFYAYCIDVTQMAGGWATYQIVDLEQAPMSNAVGPMSQQKADSVRELFGRVFHTTAYQTGGAKYQEAFAAALWEIIFEDPANSFNVSYQLGSSFWMNGMDSGADVLAQGWLNQLNGEASYRDEDVFALVHPDLQDFALTVPGYSDLHEDEQGSEVPEPLTMLGVLAALGSAGAYIRRRRLA